MRRRPFLAKRLVLGGIGGLAIARFEGGAPGRQQVLDLRCFGLFEPVPAVLLSVLHVLVDGAGVFQYGGLPLRLGCGGG